MSEYQIDILRDKLSYKKFRVLLKNLNPKSALMRVIGIRAMSYEEARKLNLEDFKRINELNQPQNNINDNLNLLFGMLKKEK